MTPKKIYNKIEQNAEYILIPGGSYKFSVARKTTQVPDLYFAKYKEKNMITPTKNYIEPQNPLVGNRVPCPFGCTHQHLVVAGRQIVQDALQRPEYQFTGERTSICGSLASATKQKACRIVWASGRLLTESEANELYKLWQAEIFREAAEYGAH